MLSNYYLFGKRSSPNGTTLASRGDGEVRLWDVVTGQHKVTLKGHTDRVYSVAFSPDGTTLASASRDGEVRLWDAVTGQHKATLKGHTDWVYSVAFSPDGITLASASGDGEVRLWDAVTGQHKATLKDTWIGSIAFSPDSTTLASGGYKDVQLWDVGTGQHKATLRGHTNEVYSVVFNPNGTTLASEGDGEVRLWDAVTGQHKATLKDTWIGSIAFNPDGTTLASGGKDVQLWDAVTGQLKTTLRGHMDQVARVAFSPDGRTLASGSADSTVLLWDMSPYLTPITLPEFPAWDVNEDGIVNILDLVTVGEQFGQKDDGLSGDINDDGIVNILDLVMVSAHLSETTTPKAPVIHREKRLLFPKPVALVPPETIQEWIDMAYVVDDGSPAFRQGIANLKRLLAMLIPSETALLRNYPNPFNPETWIPYHLADNADVQIAIYDTKGVLVCLFNLGHQRAGHYTDRSRAAYWDGLNGFGERVASGIYFYQLRADDVSSLRKMVILQ